MALAESRVRAETLAAKTVLQDIGALSMMSSDAHAMGRVGEVFKRTFQMAHHCKVMRGKLKEDSPDHDNFRALRYLAKLTINPAITHGLSHVIGSLESGKLADIVLWPVQWFGAKPNLVIKGGMINMADEHIQHAVLPLLGTLQQLRYSTSHRRAFCLRSLWY